jgi:beta-lactamase regulating signal transducer with metallopeptidase domain
MTDLRWVHSGEAVALGWTLLHFCWQSTIIALLYLLADRCLNRAATAIRYGVAMTMLGLMPIAALATFVKQEDLMVHFAQDSQQLVASQTGSLRTNVVEEAPFAAPAMAASELWIAGHGDQLMPWIDGLWLTGVCLLALRAAGGWLRLRSLRRRAQLTVLPAIQKSFAKVIAQLRLAQPVTLRISAEVISPLAMGIWRTSVILPLSVVTSLSPEKLEAVLAHELAHIRRWDYLCNLLQTAIECLFFFHPAVWWISRRTRELREVCCDEIAAGTCRDPGIYARALLQMEERRAEHLQLAVALHGRGGTLLRRIRRVMGEKTMEQRSLSGVRIVAAGLVLAGLAAAPYVASGLKEEHTRAEIAAGTKIMTAGSEDSSPRVTAATDKAATKAAAAGEMRIAELNADGVPPAATEIAAVQAAGSPAVHNAAQASTPNPEPARERTQGHYLQKMRDAGYALDLNKDLDTIISLRSVGVTPEYAKAMAQEGWGVPSLKQLVSLKAVGVTPEYVASLKSSSAAPSSFQEVISEKAVGVTPEYAKDMSSLGLGTPTIHDVISMKAVGVTPEYAAELKAEGFAPRDLHELVSFRAVGVTPEYAKAMASAGFQGLSAHDLVSLKAQGVSPEYVRWIRTTFPNADLGEVRKAAVFHIDEEFMNKAKAHSFNSTDLDKLVKLKMAGLLD